MPHARILESTADSHLIWFSPNCSTTAERILRFLVARPLETPNGEDGLVDSPSLGS